MVTTLILPILFLSVHSAYGGNQSQRYMAGYIAPTGVTDPEQMKTALGNKLASAFPPGSSVAYQFVADLNAVKPSARLYAAELVFSFPDNVAMNTPAQMNSLLQAQQYPMIVNGETQDNALIFMTPFEYKAKATINFYDSATSQPKAINFVMDLSKREKLSTQLEEYFLTQVDGGSLNPLVFIDKMWGWKHSWATDMSHTIEFSFFAYSAEGLSLAQVQTLLTASTKLNFFTYTPKLTDLTLLGTAPDPDIFCRHFLKATIKTRTGATATPEASAAQVQDAIARAYYYDTNTHFGGIQEVSSNSTIVQAWYKLSCKIFHKPAIDIQKVWDLRSGVFETYPSDVTSVTWSDAPAGDMHYHAY